MENFTPVSGFLGGLLIGLASVLMLVLNGRIAGISGIFGGLLTPRSSDFFWRLLFIGGLVLGGLIYSFLTNGVMRVSIQGDWILLSSAGLLVGLGTRLGSGCTSGHAICGIARFSKRSIVATIIFMGTAMITVFVRLHLLGS